MEDTYSGTTLHDTKAWDQDRAAQEDKASVMGPYVKGMRLLKIVGLPLRIAIKDGGVVTFEDWFRRTKCGIKVGEIIALLVLH